VANGPVARPSGEDPPARPPEPTSAASAECHQRDVGVEQLDAGAGLRVDVEKRLKACSLSGVRGTPPVPSRCPVGGLGKGQPAQVVCRLGRLAAGRKECPFVGLQKPDS
jgi:hypothetical protein